jgi:putative Holliday junction resolvase
MKYLGIDYGSKRIGVAVSDEGAVMAFPLGTVEAGKGALAEVLDIIKENGVMVAVLGESRDLSGKPNPIMKEVEKFAEALQENHVAVEFEPELFTSAQAERQGRDKRGEKLDGTAHRDASAAALILQSYLDQLRRNG